MSKKKIVATFSRGIAKKNEIKKCLKVEKILLNPSDNTAVDYVVGWGRKPNTVKPRAYAKKNNLVFYSLEQGFLHSMGQEVLGYNSLSLVKDKQGIYYDATRTSDLEDMLSSVDEDKFSQELIDRAQKAIKRIIQSNISKYNNGSLHFDDSLFDSAKIVLIIDQIAGDMSLKYGYVNTSTFDDMMQAALKENPYAQIVVKTHPDVITGRKKGCINLQEKHHRVTVISENINPLVLLRKVDAVYVATSQMGFEALMLGKRVICFGIPFYAGWGLTEDRANKDLPVWQRRNKERSLEEVFTAAYIHYSLYLDPNLNEPCDLEDIISHFEKQFASGRQTQIINKNNRINWFSRLVQKINQLF